MTSERRKRGQEDKDENVLYIACPIMSSRCHFDPSIGDSFIDTFTDTAIIKAITVIEGLRETINNVLQLNVE